MFSTHLTLAWNSGSSCQAKALTLELPPLTALSASVSVWVSASESSSAACVCTGSLFTLAGDVYKECETLKNAQRISKGEQKCQN